MTQAESSTAACAARASAVVRRTPVSIPAGRSSADFTSATTVPSSAGVIFDPADAGLQLGVHGHGEAQPLEQPLAAVLVHITVMSDLVRRAGGVGLDPRWTVTPVGGIDKMPTFVPLLGGSNHRIAVVMDVAAGGNQKISSLVRRGLPDQQRLIPLT